jgi:signal transduction histidine kinase/ActR/RegA family two-component response regulator
MDINARREAETRVLLVAPTTRDGEVTRSLLAKAGLACVVCEGLHELAREIETGAGVVLLTEEVLKARAIDELLTTFANQPPWSDLGIVLLMQAGMLSPASTRVLRSLRNVTLLERPAPARSVVSAVQTAIRGRERQYQIRDQIESIERAEATSRELRRQLELAVDASELGTFHCEMPLGRIVWNEQCKQHFWLPPDAEVDFDLFYSILHPDDREPTRQAVAACVHGGQIYDIEYRTVSPQGEVRWIRATGRTTCDERQQPVQFDGTTRDVTDRKRAEEALTEANRRKDEFLATLAHELRNPLAPIRNSLHLLRLSGDLSPSLDPVREIMERQVDQMVRLIDDLLDVSRISSGKIELQREAIELATVVSLAVQTAQPAIDAAGHQLALSLPAEPIILEVDPVRLAQIIGNLLNNAAKYTKPGGQIWLTAHEDRKEAVISIRDTGLGIPADMLPLVFNMFAQVDRTLTRAQGGLGIGLTLAKTYVEMHGGRIVAHSDGPDQGSEFIIYLPIMRDTRLGSPQTIPLPVRSTSFSRRRILIVDDTRAAGFILGKLLEKMGQQVHTATDAAAALDWVRRGRPDLVISDIAMPNMDGYELARQLRNAPGTEGLLLVALTGYGQDSDKQRAKDAGFDYHLVKPVSLEALQDLLASLPASREEVNSENNQQRRASP